MWDILVIVRGFLGGQESGDNIYDVCNSNLEARKKEELMGAILVDVGGFIEQRKLLHLHLRGLND